MLDVRTTRWLTREQGLHAQQALMSVISTSTMQEKFDQLEAQAGGHEEKYALLLASTLRGEVYPEVCVQLGFPREQAREFIELMTRSWAELAKGDIEMQENRVELETLLRNSKGLKQAQFMLQALKEAVASASRSRAVEAEPDLVYPTGDILEESGKATAELLARKGFCLVQMSESEQTCRQAAYSVFQHAAEIEQQFVQELESAYLGSDNITQVKAIPPDVMQDVPPALKRLSQQVFSALNVVGLHTEEYFGHACWATTSLLARVSEESNDIVDSRQLKDEDCVKVGPVQAYERFIRGRTVCALYMVQNAGGVIHLRPRSNSHFAAVGFEALDIALSPNTMLIFRHDQISYSYQPKGPSLALQSWLLTDIPLAEQNSKVAPLTGVKEPPPGDNAQVMNLTLRMPGNTTDGDSLWQMFSAGTDGDVSWPESRFDMEPYYTSGADYMTTGKSYTHHGAFMSVSKITDFDNDFFGICEDDASHMGPGQRILTELGYEVLYKSGHTRYTVAGENIGIYLGDSGMDWGSFAAFWSYAYYGKATNSDLCLDIHNGTTAGRLSWLLDMRGPVQTADTACSSSLVALQAGHKVMFDSNRMASQSEAISTPHSILAGGQNVFMNPSMYCSMSMAGMLTHHGRCFTFDNSADGFQRGEGCGMMFVKWSGDPMDMEERFACLVGTCCGQDGKSASLTAPNGPAQQDVIRRSMRMASLDPSLISVCECHGTGTALGDPIEIGSLQGVMKGKREFPLINTSAKTNISHLEPVAGMAGVIKCVLMVAHSCGPPNCHLLRVNQNLITNGYPVFFQQEICDLSFSTTFIGVSSFGYGGTNARADVYGRCLYGARNTGNVWTKERMENRALAYAHGLRNTYKGYGKIEKKVLSEPISIMGSWDNFKTMTRMKEEKPGCFVHRFVLGLTRKAYFHLCMYGIRSKRLYPAVDNASSTALICGPDLTGTEGSQRWMIDGRNDAAHAGTRYCITFKWQEDKSISWEPEHNQEILTREYYICQLSTGSEPEKMSLHSGEDGLYEGEVSISAEGVAHFHIQCGDDIEQAIYPDESGLAHGPDKARKGRNFEVRGPPGETMKVRLRVYDAHLRCGWPTKVSVAVFSGAGIRKSWVNTKYYLTGSFNGWKKEQLCEDRCISGLYKYHLVLLKDELVEYKIGVDAVTSHDLRGISAVFPEANPEVLDAMRDFTGKAGSSWQIIFDLNQDDPHRMIYHRPASYIENNTVNNM